MRSRGRSIRACRPDGTTTGLVGYRMPGAVASSRRAAWRAATEDLMPCSALGLARNVPTDRSQEPTERGRVAEASRHFPGFGGSWPSRMPTVGSRRAFAVRSGPVRRAGGWVRDWS
ncbi:hypothetical protein EWB00_000825, partial [Schistosoma japonicum]